MHTKLNCLLVLFVLMTATASAQKDLVVYHVAGNVNILAGNNSIIAKRGDIIKANSSLQVKQGSSSMIINEKGRSVQVYTGTYTFAALQKLISGTANTGVTQKFFSYVYENLFPGKKGDKLSVSPVVFRGEELMKMPLDNSIIIADAFTLGWKKPSGKIPVQLAIWNNNNDKLFDTILRNSTSLPVDIAKYNFVPGKEYKWKTEESDTRQPKEKYFYFLIADKKDRKEILKDIKLLQDKKLTRELKLQMQHDVFHKWKQFYLQKS